MSKKDIQHQHHPAVVYPLEVFFFPFIFFFLFIPSEDEQRFFLLLLLYVWKFNTSHVVTPGVCLHASGFMFLFSPHSFYRLNTARRRDTPPSFSLSLHLPFHTSDVFLKMNQRPPSSSTAEQGQREREEEAAALCEFEPSPRLLVDSHSQRQCIRSATLFFFNAW